MQELWGDIPESRAERDERRAAELAARDFFENDARRLGYLKPGGAGLRAYYRDNGMIPPDEPEITPHLQLQEIEGQETMQGNMMQSNSIVTNPYAVPRRDWREATALERRQVGEPVVSIGGIGFLGSSRSEMIAAIRQARASKLTEEKRGSLLDRFLDKVDEGGACHEWTGARNADGRGVIKAEGRLISAHRLSWILHFGSEPPAALVQSCGNVACVRPEHLTDSLEQAA